MFTEFYPFKQEQQGIYLYLKVTPKAAQNRIGKVIADSTQPLLRVYVTSVPENNKANLAVIELLSKELGIAKSKISIIKGHTHHNKLCLITEVSEEALLALKTICG